MIEPRIPIHHASELLSKRPREDLHLHTDFTDGKPTIREYVDRAVELGLETIGFPEHCNLKTTWLSTFRPALEAERERVRGKLVVYWGIEARGMSYDGAIAAKPEMIEAAEYVYGAFHSSLTSTPFPELPTDVAIAMEFAVTIGMIRARSCHAIAHPGGLSRKYHGRFPDELFDEIARTAAREDVALELNSAYNADIVKQLATFRKYDNRVVLGSNAHELGELGHVVAAISSLPETR
ncbi:MAG TPA: PHP domain-containing protein [Labilithrix sp.]|jgi:histidinol phosphatase-like PHP family hydrolase|nr:PHP domain-containing protein [Labilithrix sp.]